MAVVAVDDGFRTGMACGLFHEERADGAPFPRRIHMTSQGMRKGRTEGQAKEKPVRERGATPCRGLCGLSVPTVWKCGCEARGV
ncbi:hypothetical protein GCM10010329_38150 [Streptomyces spiroverticillatus]|uniref:Uncharacterized protein n=1 Tax=Streptomyces finlayi TaxID=67296 RepID=A0A918WY22_9ACTN|nr:hypothetical protein GCM10010329_38150 [Streptomyces spiroverticillatus]GHC94931.1 hypothetical protein GCM10010334_33460 [Streptomyces finlayi]